MTRPEQVFVGCPYTPNVRRNYDRLKADLEARTPLHFVLADTTTITSSDYLLEHITRLIRDSAGCIFDATGSNPNVSLEVGIAHSLAADFLLTMSTRKAPGGRPGTRRPSHVGADRVRPIIADLQGKNRIEYKTYVTLRDQTWKRYLARLPMARRWQEFEKDHRVYVPYALRLFHELRTGSRVPRRRVEVLLSESGISTTAFTRALTHHRLVTVRRGREGGYYYPVK
jgi:hypothetical protein